MNDAVAEPSSSGEPGRPTRLRWGIQPITYGLGWEEARRAATAVDEHGYDYLWGHDHLWSTGGDPMQPFFEGWTTVAAWAALTQRVRIGILVGANPFRNPGLVAKMAATLDHISAGRAVLGMGAGNRPDETRAHGLDTGSSVGQRLDWLDESLTIIRGILAGETISEAMGHYAMDGARQAPAPVQQHIPIAIGASGERKALRVVAGHADIWHQWLGPDAVDTFRHKSRVLDQHLEDVGRPAHAIERHVGGRLVIRDSEAEAERFFAGQVELHGWDPAMTSFTWAGTPERLVEWISAYREAGMDAFSSSVAAPLDLESVERLATEVRPHLDAA